MQRKDFHSCLDCQKVMAILYVVIGTCFFMLFTASLTILWLIYKYIKRKPLGLQSDLDDQILDCLKCEFFFVLSSAITIYAGLFHGHLNSASVIMIRLIATISARILFAIAQIAIFVRAALIFVPGWATVCIHKMGSQIQIFSRFLALFISVISLFMDIKKAKEDISDPLVPFLTGLKEIEEPFYIGPGNGLRTQMIILLLTFIGKVKIDR